MEADNAKVDMTPMLDIVFILLIFFIVTTSFVQEVGIEVNKPQTTESKISDNQSMLVTIKADGSIWSGGRELGADQLVLRFLRFKAQTQQTSVTLKASSVNAHAQVMAVMDKLVGAGVERLSLSTSDG